MTVFVCFDKDIECGDRPENWCSGCPKRGNLQVAVAPHAAAGPWPTAMRQATPEEARWLHLAIRRSSAFVSPGKLPEAAVRHLMQVAHRWAAEPNDPDIGRSDILEIELRKALIAGLPAPDETRERADFEQWHRDTFMENPGASWNAERNLYENFSHHCAWKGWQAHAAAEIGRAALGETKREG